jgi:hypothetical protein
VAKRQTPDISALAAPERILLFCVGSDTDWQRVGVPDEIVTRMTVRGFVSRDALGRLELTDSGRAALRTLLPEL